MVGQRSLIPPPLFGAVVGSGTRDPGWIKKRIREIRDKHPGIGSATLELRMQPDPDPAWQFFVAIDKNMFSIRYTARSSVADP